MRNDLTIRLSRLLGVVVLSAATLLSVAVVPALPAAADANEAPGSPAAFRALTASGSNSCAILANGTVRC